MSRSIAVYRLYNDADELLYVGMGVNPEGRFKFHAKFKPWWPEVARRDIRWAPDRPTALREEAEAIASEHPRYNIMLPGLGGSARGSSHRAGVPALALGASPPQPPDMRNARIPDDVWLPGLARAEMEGHTATDALMEAFRSFGTEPPTAAYDYTFANWPEAGEWAQGGQVAALYEDLFAATVAYSLEYVAVAAWLATRDHPADVAQQKRIIAGHILRRALAPDAIGWRDKYRDPRHLAEVVQAIIERHLPLGEG